MVKVETDLMKEIRSLRGEIKRVSMIVESRLIGWESPTMSEIKAIKEFERRKKEGGLKLVPLSKLA